MAWDTTTNKTAGDMKTCYYCGCADGEMRPYGPNMSYVCFDCGTSPEHVDETDKNFAAQMQAAGEVVLLTDEGPVPLEEQNVQ